MSYPAHGVVQRAIREGSLVRQPCADARHGAAPRWLSWP
jgi:hypothetical protein